MSLLNEIQASLLGESSNLEPMLLKLRFLAAGLEWRMESWVQHGV